MRENERAEWSGKKSLLQATSLVIAYQVVAVDADFGHATVVILTGQAIGPFPAGAAVNFKTIATNSAGTTESAVQTITLS